MYRLVKVACLPHYQLLINVVREQVCCTRHLAQMVGVISQKASTQTHFLHKTSKFVLSNNLCTILQWIISYGFSIEWTLLWDIPKVVIEKIHNTALPTLWVGIDLEILALHLPLLETSLNVLRT